MHRERTAFARRVAESRALQEAEGWTLRTLEVQPTRRPGLHRLVEGRGRRAQYQIGLVLRDERLAISQLTCANTALRSAASLNRGRRTTSRLRTPMGIRSTSES